MNIFYLNLSYPFLTFWSRYPAFLHSLSLLLGYFIALHSFYSLIFVELCLLYPFIHSFFQEKTTYFKPFILCILIFITSWFCGTLNHVTPYLTDPGVEGVAYLKIDSLALKSSHFGKSWLYRCHLDRFFDETGQLVAKNVKCVVVMKEDNRLKRPDATRAYMLNGRLISSTSGYRLKIDSQKPWFPIQGSLSLTDWRFQVKAQITQLFKTYFSNPKVATFLTGLSIGDFDDISIQETFFRFGLLHILAISGFHFAIVSGFIGFLLKLIFPYRYSILLVVGLLSLYFLFLGLNASISRAWTMITVALMGDFFHKKGSALNSLGIALILILLVDPLLIKTIGFQFSFLATAGILLLYSPFNTLLEFILPKRPLSEMIEMDVSNQIGYCILTYFRLGLALALAINLFVLPLTFFYFKQFPLMSLFYNFFFPFFVSISMFLLILGILFSLIYSPMGQIIHFINNYYTEWVLSLTFNLPSSVDIFIYSDFFSLEMTIIFVVMISWLGILLKSYFAKQKVEQDFAYL